MKYCLPETIILKTVENKCSDFTKAARIFFIVLTVFWST